ncbi:hypothetical protein Tco_0180636 [Tanacetum coccineum]
MVTVPIHQDTSSVPLMTTPVIDLTISQPVSTTIQALLPTSTAIVTAITTTTSLPPIPPQSQQGSSDSILIQCIGELEQHMVDMVEANQALEERLDKQGNRLYNLENLDIPHKKLAEADIKEILHHRMWESNSYQAHKDHKMLYEALEKSMARDHTDQLLTDLAEARRKKKKRHDSPKTPPGLKPSVSSIPEDLHIDADSAPDEQVYSSDDEDIGHDHIPKVNLKQDWWKPLSRYQMEECHKLLTNQVDDAILRYNVSKPLPLGGQSKGNRPAVSILKMKAAYYPDVGLEQMVPDQMWIEEECKYNVAAMYERDFKYLYPSDFEDLYLLNLQGHLNHLPPKDKKILTTATQLNLTKPRWDATGFEYKHDFTVIDSLRAVTFWDKYGVQMIMRFNEIHKFSDGTLQQIDEALDYRVK